MSKLKEGELLKLLRESFEQKRMNLWSLRHDISKEEFNERMEKLNKGEAQIKTLIRRPEVDEEFVIDMALYIAGAKYADDEPGCRMSLADYIIKKFKEAGMEVVGSKKEE